MTKQTRNPSQTPPPGPKEPRGGQAQKPGAPGDSYYGSTMARDLRKVLAEAGVVKDLDQEIELLRFRLRGLLVNKPDKDYLIFKAIELIIRAYAAKMRVSKDSQDPDDSAVIDALREAADTLGLDRVPWSQC